MVTIKLEVAFEGGALFKGREGVVLQKTRVL